MSVTGSVGPDFTCRDVTAAAICWLHVESVGAEQSCCCRFSGAAWHRFTRFVHLLAIQVRIDCDYFRVIEKYKQL